MKAPHHPAAQLVGTARVMRCLDKSQPKIATLQDAVYNLGTEWLGLGELLKMRQPAAALSEQALQMSESRAGRQIASPAQFVGKQVAFDEFEDHSLQHRKHHHWPADRATCHLLEFGIKTLQ